MWKIVVSLDERINREMMIHLLNSFFGAEWYLSNIGIKFEDGKAILWQKYWTGTSRPWWMEDGSLIKSLEMMSKNEKRYLEKIEEKDRIKVKVVNE